MGNDAYLSLDFSIKGSDFEIDMRAIIPPLLHSVLSLAHTSFFTHSTTRSVAVNTDSWSHLLLVYQQDSIYLSIVTSEVTQHSSPRIQSSWKISIKYFFNRGSCLSSQPKFDFADRFHRKSKLAIHITYSISHWFYALQIDFTGNPTSHPHYRFYQLLICIFS